MKLSVHSKNLISLFGGDVMVRGLGFFATTYLARTLGASGFGMINIGISVLAYTMIISEAGLMPLGTRQLAGTISAHSLLSGRIITTRLLLSALVYGCVATGLILFTNPGQQRMIILIYALYLFPSSVLLEWFLRGVQRIGDIYFARFWGHLTYLVLVFLFVHDAGDTLRTAWTWVAGGMISAMMMTAIYYKRGYRIELPAPSALRVRSLLRESVPLGIATLIARFPIEFPILYLGWYASTETAGFFSAAVKLITIILIFDRVFYNIFFPLISRCAEQSPERLEEIFSRLLRLVSVFSTIVALLAISVSDWLIVFVFGAEYNAAVPIFKILTAFFVFTLLTSMFTFTLIALKRERIYLLALVASSVAFLMFLYLIPAGELAAGLAAALTLFECTAFAVMAISLRRTFKFDIVHGIMLPVLAGLLIALGIHAASGWSVYSRISAVLFLALPVLVWAARIDRSDIDFVLRRML